MALTLVSSRHIPCAVTGEMRTAHGVCLLLCGQSECHWADAVRLTKKVSLPTARGITSRRLLKSRELWAKLRPLIHR